MFKILGRTSSINVRKVLWAANEIGQPFIHEDEWGSSLDLKQDKYLELNPNGLVPVLIHEKGALWESNTICRYLAMRANRTDLLPADFEARADVEKWMDWQASELNPSWRAAFMAHVRKDAFFLKHPELVEKSVNSWNEKMQMLEAFFAQKVNQRLNTLKDDYYLHENQFTLADIVIALSVQRWLLTPIDKPNTPYLIEYHRRIMNRRSALSCIKTDVV